MKCRARMAAHHTLKGSSRGKKTNSRKYHSSNYRQKKRDSKRRQLTGSLVFDEEQLEALLESVLIHIELYLHPKRRTERWAETDRQVEIRRCRKEGAGGGTAGEWRDASFIVKSRERRK